MDYLLGPKAQKYFADETFEYPVVEGITHAGTACPPLEDLERLEHRPQRARLPGPDLAMLDEVGLT